MPEHFKNSGNVYSRKAFLKRQSVDIRIFKINSPIQIWKVEQHLKTHFVEHKLQLNS